MKWDCHNCTLCCRLLALGPVAPEIIHALENRGVAQAWAPAAEGWYHETPEGLFLDHRDDSCVFLRDDGLCAVHALYGPEAKPAFCRTFPFTRVQQPGGIVHAVRADCGGTWRAQDDGTPVAEHVAALPPDAPMLVWGQGPVHVLPGVGVAPEDWLALEAQLIQAVDDQADPATNVAAVRDGVLHALRRSPPPPDPVRASAAVRSVHTALVAALAPAVPAEPQGTAQRFLANLVRGLGEADLDRVPPSLDAASCRYFAGVLRQHLRGKAFVSQGAVCWGLSALALGITLARARSPEPTLARLAPWHVQWARFTRNEATRALLAHHRDTLWDGVLHSE